MENGHFCFTILGVGGGSEYVVFTPELEELEQTKTKASLTSF